MEAGWEGPGVAASFVVGSEQLGLADFVVGRNASVESKFDVVERSAGVAAQQVQAGPFEQQVDVVQAVAAVARDLQTPGNMI